ncbi:MAG: glycine betaine/L-proline ABC transporter substrate-binding protein ProX [Desulfovibrionales bacterium]|nr:glycine betaine/L-proline ABC transporter substrate-binding protein ProX [Desulfovibrionales bacterium]
MVMKKLFFGCLLLLMALPAHGYQEQPGKGVTITPARATWITGYFHETIIRKGLQELGYTVKRPKELTPAIFYNAVSLGDIDYWPNSWLPNQSHLLTKRVAKKASQIGYVLKAQGLQGYVVSKKYADKFNIKSLADFKRPEVIEAFDRDNDGKADLTGCPSGWVGAKIIDQHLKEYGLTKSVKNIKASYEAAMASNLAAHRNGEPVFYYAWTPSWTVFKMKPGKDIVWINVPYNFATSDSANTARMSVSDVTGAVSSPLDMGFDVADIRIVANNKFLEKNPAAKKFFELFRMDVEAMNAQQVKVQDGEKSPQDVNRHADEWIAAHQEQWNGWLEQARQAAL